MKVIASLGTSEFREVDRLSIAELMKSVSVLMSELLDAKLATVASKKDIKATRGKRLREKEFPETVRRRINCCI